MNNNHNSYASICYAFNASEELEKLCHFLDYLYVVLIFLNDEEYVSQERLCNILKVKQRVS